MLACCTPAEGCANDAGEWLAPASFALGWVGLDLGLRVFLFDLLLLTGWVIVMIMSESDLVDRVLLAGSPSSGCADTTSLALLFLGTTTDLSLLGGII